MHLSKLLITTSVLAAIASPSFAASVTHDVALLQGPAITASDSPYDGALACLSDALSAEQKKIVYSVLIFPDRTDKRNIAAAEASGSHNSQGYADALVTSLAKSGVEVVDVSPEFRSLTDWIVQRRQTPGIVNMKTPDVVVSGSINKFDALPGKVLEAGAFGLEGGTREHRFLIGFDARATLAPFNQMGWASQVVSTFAYKKQLVAYENKAGLTSFFGGGSTRSIVSFNANKAEREPIQFVGGVMMDVVAYRVVRDVSKYTGCDETFRHAELTYRIETERLENKRLAPKK